MTDQKTPTKILYNITDNKTLDLDQILLSFFNTYEKTFQEEQESNKNVIINHFINDLNYICEEYKTSLIEILRSNNDYCNKIFHPNNDFIGFHCIKAIFENYQTNIINDNLELPLIHAMIKLNNPLDLLIKESIFSSECIKNNCVYIFRIAAKNGHLDVLKWLTNKFKLTTTDARSEGEYAFMVAAYHCHLDILQWLAEVFDITANYTKEQMLSAVLCGVRSNKLQVVEWLINRFDLTIHDIRMEENHLIRCCAIENYWDALKWLIERFNLTHEDIIKAGHNIILLCALFNEDCTCDMLKWLIERFNLAPRKVIGNGYNMFQDLVKRGYLDKAQLIIDKYGIIIDYVLLYTNFSMARMVARHGRLHILQWLIDKSNLTGYDAKNFYARLISFKINGSTDLEIIQFLIDKFNLTNDTKYNINSVFVHAIKKGDLRVICWLNDKYNISIEDVLDYRLIQLAMKLERLDILQWMIKKFEITHNSILNIISDDPQLTSGEKYKNMLQQLFDELIV